jgi:hypothetical protein
MNIRSIRLEFYLRRGDGRGQPGYFAKGTGVLKEDRDFAAELRGQMKNVRRQQQRRIPQGCAASGVFRDWTATKTESAQFLKGARYAVAASEPTDLRC